MTKSTALYIITGGTTIVARSLYMIRELEGRFDQLYVAVPKRLKDSSRLKRIEKMVDDVILDDNICNISTGIKAGLNYLRQDYKDGTEEIWIISSDVYGPLGDMNEHIQTVRRSEADVIAPYFHNTVIDPRFTETSPDERIPYLDFTVFKEGVLGRAVFWDFLTNMPKTSDYWEDFTKFTVPFFRALSSAEIIFDYFLDPTMLETADPRIWEFHKIAENAPVFSQAALFLQPELYDLYAIYGERALQAVKAKAPKLHEIVWADILLDNSLRDIYTKFDEMEIIPDRRLIQDRTEWGFGEVAIFIHAYYARMMPEFWELIVKIPGKFKLFITTATEENQIKINEFLVEHGLPKTQYDVRVVEVNRGRDMSSLFITFKDVILSGEYDVCLRLHSKRTPQVARQVGESFKDHLFENLVYNEDYVANIYDYLEDNPNIGLLIPPVIHIGFGTLGHSWFNNRDGVESLIGELDLSVILDEHTPIAPYGTMYWFRAEALKQMFAWPWRFDSYNKEPNHVDGGLAHLQERLIGYVCQNAGYRVVSIMNRHAAARNYVKLEYKAQLFAAHMPTANIYEQRNMLMEQLDDQVLGMSKRQRRNAYQRLASWYQRVIVRTPVLHKIVKPVTSRIGAGLRKLR